MVYLASSSFSSLIQPTFFNFSLACTVTKASIEGAPGDATNEDRSFLLGQSLLIGSTKTFQKPQATYASNNFVTVSVSGRRSDGSCILSDVDGWYFG